MVNSTTKLNTDGSNRAESSVPIQVLNLGDGAAFIPIGATSPFFQISSGHGNSNSISAESLSVAASNGTITNLVNSQQTTHSGAITLSAQQYEQLTNNQGNEIIELMATPSESSNPTSNHLSETSAHINNEASTSRLTTNGNPNGGLRGNTPDNRSQQRPSNTITEPAGEEPIYVNAKQYDRILIRRAARARLEAQGRLPKERRKYMHESRHRHAISRARGGDGKYQNGVSDTASNKSEENSNNL